MKQKVNSSLFIKNFYCQVILYRDLKMLWKVEITKRLLKYSVK